jgi:hypothetical protein
MEMFILFCTVALSENGQVLGKHQVLFESAGKLLALLYFSEVFCNLVCKFEILRLFGLLGRQLLMSATEPSSDIFIHDLSVWVASEEVSAAQRLLHLLLQIVSKLCLEELVLLQRLQTCLRLVSWTGGLAEQSIGLLFEG